MNLARHDSALGLAGRCLDRALRAVTVATMMVALGGCALAPGTHVDLDDSRAGSEFRVMPVTAAVIADLRRREDRRKEAERALTLQAQDPARPMREYQVGPGDVLSVVVWDHPELTNPYGDRGSAADGLEIGPDGRVFFPYAGLVRVEGMTVREIRQVLTDRLGAVMRAPQLDVRIATYRSQRVQVTGEVAQPGLVALDNTSKGVLDALGERGGLSERASRRHVFLSRGGERFEIDLVSLYGGKAGSFSPVLQPGDVVRVPDTSEDQVVVLGAVQQPRSLPITADTLSAIQAIAAAGGADRESARGSAIYVFRGGDVANGVTPPIQVFQIDLQRPQGVLFATHFPLQPRDVVYVATSGLAKFNSVMRQLLPTLQEIFYIDRLTDRRG